MEEVKGKKLFAREPMDFVPRRRRGAVQYQDFLIK